MRKMGIGLGVGINRSNYATSVGLLDLFPNASVAYSLRLLRTAYTGSAIRVRRSSDNTESDIGFTALGNLDTTSLTSFCGSGNGFVTTWYDQSGNGRNATQTTAANQPQIVSSGSVLTLSSKPSLDFNGSSQFLLTGNVTYGNVNKIATFITSRSRTNNATRLPFAHNDNSTYRAFGGFYYQGTGRFAAQFNSAGTTQTNSYDFYGVNTNYIVSTFFQTNETNAQDRIVVYVNNALNTFSSNTNSAQGNITNVNNPLSIGSDGLGNFRMDGLISEIIFYASDQLSNRTGINTNINSFYSIY